MSHQMILMLSHLDTGSLPWRYGRGSSDSLEIAEEENAMVHWKLVKKIDKAKAHVLHMVQGSHFSKDIAALSSSRKLPRSSRLSKLDVFIDESGLIRIGGRIRHSSLSDDIKHPVVSPSDHEVSSQIIQYFHQRSHHQGRGITCSEVRNQGFWILSLQNMVNKMIRACVTCSRLRGKENGWSSGGKSVSEFSILVFWLWFVWSFFGEVRSAGD